jgi:uncharacterized protein
MRVAVSIGALRVEIELLETVTTKALVEAMPFKSKAQTWGEEVYFSTPVKARLEKDACQVVAPGTVCFWTEGDAIALPYGRTPISSDERPKLASRCNVLGKIVGDPRRLAAVKAGESVSVEKA